MENKYPKIKKEGATFGSTLGPAMEITEQSDADQYFERLVEFQMENFSQSREEAEGIVKNNLGYYAGYYDNETRIRVEKLFNCAHPIFGFAAEHIPTPEEAIKAGIKWAGN